MDWILAHLWVLVVVAGLVARVLQAARGKSAAPGRRAPPAEKPFADPDLAERTRKIREEIQRKIEERRGESGQRPVTAAGSAGPRTEVRPPPAVVDLPPVIRRVLSIDPPPEEDSDSTATEADAAAAAELARQAALAEELRRVVAKKALEDRRAAMAAYGANKEQAALAVARGALLEDLSSPDSLRRAFVLREVLGPPVALR